MPAARGEVAQTSPKDGVVHLVVGQQLEGAFNQHLVIGLFIQQPEFGAHARLQCGGEDSFVGFQRGQGLLLVANERQQGLPQAKQVPVSNVGLLVVGVAALFVRVVADMARVKRIKELERAVVDGQPKNAHVVGVHHAVAKPHGLPGSHQVRGSFADRFEQCCKRVGRVTAGRIEMINDVVGQCAKLRVLIVVIVKTEMLEMTKTDEARRCAGHHGGSFDFFTAHFGV